MKTNVNTKKIAVVGAGFVGGTIAYTLAMAGIVPEIAVVDIAEDKAEGQVADIIDGASLLPAVYMHAGGYEACADADIVVITAGVGRKPGQTRLELAQINVGIIKDMVEQIVHYAPNAVLLVVSNPVDVLTYAALKYSGFPAHRVVGSGTLLDTVRLRRQLSEHLNVPVADMEAMVLGEHGDTAMVPWSLAQVKGVPLDQFCTKRREAGLPVMEDKDYDAILQRVHEAGQFVIKRKGATYYAIALVVTDICTAIIRNATSVMTVSSYVQDWNGIDDVSLSLPQIVGGRGLMGVVPTELTKDEMALLRRSGDKLRETLKLVNLID
ncbi:MAG: L-lactate dehydrogenase [Christensenellales bacterium]